MTIKKVVQQLLEAIGGVATLRAAAGGKEPAYLAVLEMVKALAEKYAAIQGAHATVTMMATGFNGIGGVRRQSKGEALPKPKKKFKGLCWAWQRGNCTRGSICMFEHSGEAGQGAAPVAQQHTPVT